MRAVVQRVTQAAVHVEGQVTGSIEHGLCVLLGVETGDAESDAQLMADKLSGLRCFSDDDGKFNHSILDTGGAVLLVSQFTLLGDCRRGKRPSFTAAARPDTAVPLYEAVGKRLRETGICVETGVFGAHMEVELVNDGPVTLLLDTKKVF